MARITKIELAQLLDKANAELLALRIEVSGLRHDNERLKRELWAEREAPCLGREEAAFEAAVEAEADRFHEICHPATENVAPSWTKRGAHWSRPAAPRTPRELPPHMAAARELAMRTGRVVKVGA